MNHEGRVPLSGILARTLERLPAHVAGFGVLGLGGWRSGRMPLRAAELRIYSKPEVLIRWEPSASRSPSGPNEAWDVTTLPADMQPQDLHERNGWVLSNTLKDQLVPPDSDDYRVVWSKSTMEREVRETRQLFVFSEVTPMRRMLRRCCHKPRWVVVQVQSL
jgi:hypothetical protein